MDKEIFITEYENITTAVHIPSSKMYSVLTNEIQRDELEKYIREQKHDQIDHKRKELGKIVGISIGCANTCNLACSYCYANAGTYGSNLREIMGVKDYDKLLSYVKRYDYPVNNFTFFGGEPLLSYEGIKYFIPQIESYYLDRFQYKPRFSIITNATLINKEIALFLNEHFDAVTISIDGPKEICDLTRIALDPAISVYNMIKNAMSYIMNLPKRNFHLRAVATLIPELLKEIEKYGILKYRNSFYELGFDSVGFFQATGIEWTKSSLDELVEFYRIVINNTIDCLISGEIQRLDDMTMAYLVDILKRHYNGDCVAGKNYLYYAPDGDTYPCQMYYNKRKHTVEAKKRYELEKCKNCLALNVCQSYCAGTALGINQSENEPIEYLCKVEKARFECVVQRYGYEIYYLKRNKEMYDKLISLIRDYATQNAAFRIFGEV